MNALIELLKTYLVRKQSQWLRIGELARVLCLCQGGSGSSHWRPIEVAVSILKRTTTDNTITLRLRSLYRLS